MSQLETLIRSLAKSGRLNHLSLGYLNNGQWGASYRGVYDADKRLVDHPDPVEALIAALSGKKPPPPPPPPPKKTRARPAPKPVAAPVDDDEDLL